jgi:7tm Odorant receptor
MKNMSSFVDFSSKFWNIVFLDLIFKQISYKDQATLREKIKFILKWATNITYILNGIVQIILGISYIYENCCSIKIFMEIFSFISIIFVLTLKFTSIVFNREMVQDLLRILPEGYSKRELKALNYYTMFRNFKIVCLIIKVYTILCLLFLIIDTILNEHQSDPKFNFGLNVNIHNFILQSIFKALVLFSLALVVILWLFVETFMYGIIISIIIEFERVKIRIVNLKSKYVKKTDRNPEQKFNLSLLVYDMPSTSRQKVKPQVIEVKSQAENLKILKKLIVRHNELFTARNYIESIFTSAFFSNLVVSSLTSCTFVYMLLNVENIAETLTISTNLLVNVLYMLLQCHFSQLLNETSQSVADSVYETGWEEVADPKIRKDLMMIIMRSQRSIAFTNLSFSNVNLEMFRKVSLF